MHPGPDFDNTPEGNFEALWTIIDEHYCFLDYKKQAIGLDWDEVHSRYRQRLDKSINNAQLFEVLAEMLSELRDGHVNLYAAHDTGRNWSWYEDFPDNFYQELQNSYLGTDYKIASSISYRILEDNIGYVVCSSFQTSFGEGNLDEVFHYLRTCNGLILDVRNNSGGNLTNAEGWPSASPTSASSWATSATRRGADTTTSQRLKPNTWNPRTACAGRSHRGPHQPPMLQRHQHLRTRHEALSTCHRHRRQDRRRQRPALLLRAAQRLERTLLRMSHVRRSDEPDRVRHTTRHPRQHHRRGPRQRERTPSSRLPVLCCTKTS